MVNRTVVGGNQIPMLRHTFLGSQFALYLTITVLPASPLNVSRAI